MNLIKLQPVSMVRPNSKFIHAPSRIENIKSITLAKFETYTSIKMLVSFCEDGVSNPVEKVAYGRGLDCWYIRINS